MKKLIVGFDVDDTLGDMVTVWRDVFVENGGKHFDVSRVRDWSFTGIFESPEERMRFYGLLSTHGPEMYERIQPYSQALRAVEEVRADGHRAVFVTSCAQRTTDAKWDWLARHGFVCGRTGRKDYFPVMDKAMVRADVLADDSMSNVNAFPGHALLINQPHNQEAMVHVMTWGRYRLQHVGEVPQYVRFIQTLL